MKRLFFTSLASAFALAAVAQGCSSAEPRSGFGTDPQSNDAGGDGSGGGFNSEGGTPIADGGFAECAKGSAGTRKVPVVLEIVLDGSGSMSGDKWTAATGALTAVFDQLQNEPQTELAVGLIRFGDSGTYPKPADVYPDSIGNATQNRNLKARLAGSPTGGTPLQAALQGGYDVLENFKPIPGSQFSVLHKKVVVAVSDGEPTDGTPQSILSLVKAKLQLADPRGPIQTFSVGIGSPTTSGYDAAFMAQLAVSGGTEAPNCNPLSESGPDICHFQIDPKSSVQQMQAEFIAALNRIRDVAASCELSLESDDLRADPGSVNVKIVYPDGKEEVIKQDASNGWTYDDPANPTKVILNGTSCDTASKRKDVKVEVILGCKTLVD